MLSKGSGRCEVTTTNNTNEFEQPTTAWHNAIVEALRKRYGGITTAEEFSAELRKIRRDAGFGYDLHYSTQDEAK
jgi:hypothetical protein